MAKRPPRYRRRKPDLNLKRVRTAVGRTDDPLCDIDHRSAWARRLKKLIADHSADLGGDANLSHSVHVLIRRASMLCLQCELIEQRWASAHDGMAPSDAALNNYRHTVNTLKQVMSELGLQRQAPDPTPSLDAYLAQRRREREAADRNGETVQ